MNKKLINIKNFLRIIISLFVIINMAKSCAKAYTFSDFLEFCNIVKDLPNSNTEQISCANWVISNENAIRNRFGTNINKDSWVVWRGSNSQWGTYTRIAGFSGGSFNGWNNSINTNLIINYDSKFSTTYIGRGGNWTNNDNSNMTFEFCLFNDTIASSVDFGNRIGNNYYVTTEYLEFINDFENSAYNGNLFTYYYKGDFFSNNHILLGNIIPNDSYYFEIRLKEDNTSIVKGTSFFALNTTPYTIYNDNAIYINENFDVYVIPRLLNYSTQYQLEIISYYGDGGDNFYEDIDWFIFLPQNAVISGDYITSLGSGDFTTQDSTNLIIGNQNQNNNNIIDFLGTAPSGDQPRIWFNWFNYWNSSIF